MLKKYIKYVVLIVILLAIVLFAICALHKENAQGKYSVDPVKRGDILNTVASTGTIEAVSTIEVGTQVSGIINRLYVDFNDQVRKGQLLAVLDTVLLQISMSDAESNVDKVNAQLEEAVSDYNRNLPLFEKGLISEAEFIPFKVRLETQKANLKSANAAFKRADRNLKYAFIRSPIDGTVIHRNVEEGQTVAASLQAPTIFIIAEDLSKMEIHAKVDESDIGQIKKGQGVRFTVQAYEDKEFTGVVEQIRLQPQTVSNVVNYTVIVAASNDEYLLLPGMTANLDFIIEEKKDVLLVPNTALRFEPAEDVKMEAKKRMEKERSAAPDSGRKQGDVSSTNSGERPPSQAGLAGQQRENMGRVWYLDESGNPSMAYFRKGTTDGKMTEVQKSRSIVEGTQVIIGIAPAGGKNAAGQNKAATPSPALGGPSMRRF